MSYWAFLTFQISTKFKDVINSVIHVLLSLAKLIFPLDILSDLVSVTLKSPPKKVCPKIFLVFSYVNE